MPDSHGRSGQVGASKAVAPPLASGVSSIRVPMSDARPSASTSVTSMAAPDGWAATSGGAMNSARELVDTVCGQPRLASDELVAVGLEPGALQVGRSIALDDVEPEAVRQQLRGSVEPARQVTSNEGVRRAVHPDRRADRGHGTLPGDAEAGPIDEAHERLGRRHDRDGRDPRV